MCIRKKNKKTIGKFVISIFSASVVMSIFQVSLPFASAPKKDTGTSEEDKEYVTENKIKYELDYENKTTKIIECLDRMVKSVTIPTTVKLKDVEYKVTEIESKAFFYCNNLKFVSLGEYINKIGTFAFPSREGYQVHFRYKTTKSVCAKIKIEKNAFTGVESLESGMESFFEPKGIEGEIIYIMPIGLYEMM